MPDPLTDGVARVLRQAARAAVLPMFRRLAESDVQEKAPGEVVTVADREAERLIDAGLRALIPGSEVVGEEAVAVDAGLLDMLRGAGPVWLVDPVDGTANFAAGRGPFVMMVALIQDRLAQGGWILDPRSDSLIWARRGEGAYVDGVRVHSKATADGPPRRQELRGSVLSRFLPRDLAASVRRGAGELGELLPGLHCAGREYPSIVDGTQDFALFWRTLPWDHAPGALFAEEAGGVVRRLDGSPYDLTDDRPGLLAAASPAIWNEVHETLLGRGYS